MKIISFFLPLLLTPNITCFNRGHSKFIHNETSLDKKQAYGEGRYPGVEKVVFFDS
jgi:hypothetical protein